MSIQDNWPKTLFPQFYEKHQEDSVHTYKNRDSLVYKLQFTSDEREMIDDVELTPEPKEMTPKQVIQELEYGMPRRSD